MREEERRDLAEAVLLNEKLKRKPPEGWDTAKGEPLNKPN